MLKGVNLHRCNYVNDNVTPKYLILYKSKIQRHIRHLHNYPNLLV